MKKFFTFIFLYITILGGINANVSNKIEDDMCTEYFRILAGRGDKFANLLGEFKEKHDNIMQYQTLAPLSGFDKQYFVSSIFGEQIFYALKGNFSTMEEAQEKVYLIQKKIAECLFDYKFYISKLAFGNGIYIQNPSESGKAQSRIQVMFDAASQQYFAALIIEIRNIEIPSDAIAYTDKISLQNKINYNIVFRSQFLSIIDSAYNDFLGLRIKDSISDISKIYECNCELEGSNLAIIEVSKSTKFYAVFSEKKSPEFLSKKLNDIRQEVEGSLKQKYPDYVVETTKDEFNRVNKYTYILNRNSKIELGIYQVNLNDENNTENYQIRLDVFLE